MCFVPVVHASGVYFAKKTHCSDLFAKSKQTSKEVAQVNTSSRSS